MPATARKWEIRSESAREQEAIEKWGKDEWNRRKAVCETKKNELEAEDGWESAIVIGNQFDAVARVMKQEQWDDFVTKPVRIWRRLVEKLILGN